MSAVRMLLLLAAACAACGNGGSDGGRLTVFAASSLTEVFTEIGAAFEDAEGVEVTFSFAGSSSLREQIRSGAPADVFAAADEEVMRPLVEEALVDEPVAFAANRPVLALAAGNPGAVASLTDLERADLLVGLCAPEVPCGRLARAVLEEAGVDASLDTEEPDVRALLTKLEAGELDAGIVYATDVALAGGAVDVVPLATDLRTTYPIAVVSGTSATAAAEAFVDFVTSGPGADLLVDRGFLDP